MSKEILELADAIEKSNWSVPSIGNVVLLHGAIAALRASAIAEPVAWIVLSEEYDRTRIWWRDKARADAWCERTGMKPIPLYAHPAPAAPVPASVREALENSQSLLAMINHLGSDRPTGIASLDWDNEGLSKLTAEQITENRAALASLPAPEAAPTREEIIEQCAKVARGGYQDRTFYERGRHAAADAILALKSAKET